MKLKISAAKIMKIRAALDAINGSSHVHTASPQDVINAATEAESNLQFFAIPKKARKGTRYIYTSGGSVPSAYKYQRNVNRITIERGSEEWFIVVIEKIEIWGRADRGYIYLTPAQRDIALADFCARFEVQS